MAKTHITNGVTVPGSIFAPAGTARNRQTDAQEAILAASGPKLACEAVLPVSETPAQDRPRCETCRFWRRCNPILSAPQFLGHGDCYNDRVYNAFAEIQVDNGNLCPSSDFGCIFHAAREDEVSG